MAQTGAVSMSMDIGGFLHRLIFRESARHAEIAKQVKREAEQLRSTAVAVQRQLARYSDADDPFVAMLADVYERRQEQNIWRGPQG